MNVYLFFVSGKIKWYFLPGVLSACLFFSCTSKKASPVDKEKLTAPVSSDTGKINGIISKALAFNQTDGDSLCYYADMALQQATAISFREGVANATSAMAACNRKKGDFSAAVSLFLSAINMFDSLGLKQQRIDAQLLLANVYKEIGGEKGTTEYLQKGLMLSEKSEIEARSVNYITGMVNSLSMQGIILRDTWKLDNSNHGMDSAFTKYENALQLIQQTGQAKEQLGKLYNNISQVYNERDKNYPVALSYLQKAVAFNTEKNNLNSLSFNYGNISNVYLGMGNVRQAHEYATKMLDVCNRLKSPHRMLNAYLTLHKLNKQLGHFDSALYYHELFVVVSDSITNVEKAGQVAEMQTRFETARKELEIARLSKSDKENKQRIMQVAVVAAILSLLLGASLWLYRRLQGQKKQIDEQSSRLQWMMKELHHRVKNNLQIVSSLLNLQTYRLTDSESISALKESQLRVQAMSLIHQRLYQAEDVSLVNFKFYINDLVETLMKAYGYTADEFDLDLQIGRELLDVDTVLPMGLMVNEIITNAFKYAYTEERRPLLIISLQDEGSQLKLEIADNGPGMPIINNQYKSKGFGKSLIDALTKQLKASYTVDGTAGMAWRFNIPYTKQQAA